MSGMVPLPHSEEFEDLAAGYALEVLEADEQERFRGHLRDCPICQRLVSEHRSVALALAASLEEVQVSPSVKTRLMDQVRREPRTAPSATEPRLGEPPKPATADPALVRRRPTTFEVAATPASPAAVPVTPLPAAARRRPPLVWLLPLAASLVLVIGLAAWNLQLQRELGRVRDQTAAAESQLTEVRGRLQAIEQELELARVGQEQQTQIMSVVVQGGRTWRLSPPDESSRATGVVIHDPSANRLIIFASGLPPLPRDQAYEAWVQRGDTMVPAGLSQASSDGVVTLSVDGANPDELGAVALSIEPASGSQSPTGPVVLITEL